MNSKLFICIQILKGHISKPIPNFEKPMWNPTPQFEKPTLKSTPPKEKHSPITSKHHSKFRIAEN